MNVETKRPALKTSVPTALGAVVIFGLLMYLAAANPSPIAHRFGVPSRNLPVWIVLAALWLGGYLWERQKRAAGASYAERMRRSVIVALAYFIPCIVGAVVARFLFPPEAVAVYSVWYWALSGLALLVTLFLAGIARSGHRCNKAAILVFASIMILAGVASAPMFVFHAISQGSGMPQLAVVAVLLIAPPLLRDMGLFSTNVNHAETG
ncbi:MAG TPA: hypothetical protein VFX38_01210 [Gammaproteobacteria bacterium]|nr:hypothetical protein [Gammaproteobacteria bacterium]